MTGFSAEWLDLREPIDHAARSETIISAVTHYFLNDETILATDIGTGTGSTIRALTPVISNKLSWHLIDHDDALIEEAKKNAAGNSVEFSLCDLSMTLDPVFFPRPDLVTTSAFLDLVSKEWLQKFITEITSQKLPFYAALTYDGRAGCTPQSSGETAVLEAFNRHQKTNKGFGPALGPDAADTAISMFKDAGYIMEMEHSDWKADHHHPEFQIMLLEGWKNAAAEIEPENSNTFSDWLEKQKKLIAKGECSVFVGHKDFFAVPAE